jgi:hypothetical protein
VKWVISYSETQQKANIAAVNLFFSALLGASLGAMRDLPLWDYGVTITLLVGAGGAIFTFSERRRMMVLMSIVFRIMLAGVIASPNLHMHADMQCMALALIIGLVTLLAIRASPHFPGSLKVSCPCSGRGGGNHP